MNIIKAVNDNVAEELSETRCEMENLANRLAELSLQCARLLAFNDLSLALNSATNTQSTDKK